MLLMWFSPCHALPSWSSISTNAWGNASLCSSKQWSKQPHVLSLSSSNLGLLPVSIKVLCFFEVNTKNMRQLRAAKNTRHNLQVVVWASFFKPLHGRTRSRGRCWAPIQLSHHPAPSGRAVHEVGGLDIRGRHCRLFVLLRHTHRQHKFRLTPVSVMKVQSLVVLYNYSAFHQWSAQIVNMQKGKTTFPVVIRMCDTTGANCAGSVQLHGLNFLP